MSWTAFLGVSNETGPNGDSLGILRCVGAAVFVELADGAVTYYSYTNSPPTKTATTNGRWVKTTMDGLGRTIKVEAGDACGTKSTVETQYDACACSPLGKVKKVSQPYAPGGTVYWTTYAYDGMGRTTQVTHPDGAATQYSYLGNTVTVTDPAGKWKKFTMDVLEGWTVSDLLVGIEWPCRTRAGRRSTGRLTAMTAWAGR